MLEIGISSRDDVAPACPSSLWLWSRVNQGRGRRDK
jgi:hypothetical protein